MLLFEKILDKAVGVWYDMIEDKVNTLWRTAGMFTKKHYIAVAKIIKAENVSLDNVTTPADRAQRITCGFISTALADYFMKDNPKRFSRDKFLAACEALD